MRILTSLQAMALPFAELLVVTGLFWAVICGNVVTDVLGTVLVRRTSLAEGWDIMERRREVPASLSDPDTNLSIFFNPVDAQGREDVNVAHKSFLRYTLRPVDALWEVMSGHLDGDMTLGASSIQAVLPSAEH